MAEVVGLIASIINILEGVDEVRVFFKANFHTTTSLRAQLAPLLGWLTAFEGLVRGLQLECELDESDDGQLKVLSHIVEPLTACEKALRTIDARLKRSIRVGKWSVSVGRILDKDTSAALHVLYQAKPLLDLALSADQRTLLKSVEIYVRTVAEDVQNLRTETQSFYQIVKTGLDEQRVVHGEDEKSQHRVEILKWISQIEYRSNLVAALRHVLPNDVHGHWFYQHREYISWTSSAEDYRNLLLTGQSGAGKTVVSAKVIESLIRQQEMKPSSGNEVLYYFFDFNDPAKQSVEGMIRSLIHQICSRSQEIPDIILKLYRRERNGRSSQIALSINDWYESLKVLCRQLPPQFLILDALDECKDADHAVLGSFLRDLLNADDLSVRWMATRRRSYNARGSELSHLDLEGPNICEIRMQNSLVDSDIRVYLYARLKSDPGLLSFNTLTKDLIVTKILEKSSGMFRYAQCQLDSLSRLKDRRLKQVAGALDKMPGDIFDTYSRMLATLQLANERVIAARVLLFVCYSARPVTILEVAEFAILEDDMNSVDTEDRFGDHMDILLLLGSLIDITDGVLSLSHRSVQEYLVSGLGNMLLRQSPDVSTVFSSAEKADAYIGLKCLQYIGFGHEWQRDNCDPNTDKMPNAKHLAELLCRYPLLDYAATRWPYHLSRKSVQLKFANQFMSTLPLTAAPNLWKAYILLLPADIWDNQLTLSQLLCEASLRSAVTCDWSRDFWTNRQRYRVSYDSNGKMAPKKSTNSADITVRMVKTPESSADKDVAVQKPHVAPRRFIARALKSITAETEDGKVKLDEGEIMIVTATETKDEWLATTDHIAGNLDSSTFERSDLPLPTVMGVPFYHLATLLLEIALQKVMPQGISSSLDNISTEEELNAHLLAFKVHVHDAAPNMGEHYGRLISTCLDRVSIPSDESILKLYRQMVIFMQAECKDLSPIKGCALELFLNQDTLMEELFMPLQAMIRGGFRASRRIRSSDLGTPWIQNSLAEESKATANRVAGDKYNPGEYRSYAVSAISSLRPLPAPQTSTDDSYRWSAAAAPSSVKKYLVNDERRYGR